MDKDKELEALREMLRIAEDALDRIGKHQHDGKRGCVCDILGFAKDKIAEIKRGIRK